MAAVVLRGDEELLTGRWLGLVVFAMAMAGCGNGDSLEQVGGSTMGSTWSVKYVRHAGVADPAQVRGEVEAILGEKFLPALLSRYIEAELLDHTGVPFRKTTVLVSTATVWHSYQH